MIDHAEVVTRHICVNSGCGRDTTKGLIRSNGWICERCDHLLIQGDLEQKAKARFHAAEQTLNEGNSIPDRG